LLSALKDVDCKFMRLITFLRRDDPMKSKTYPLIALAISLTTAMIATLPTSADAYQFLGSFAVLASGVTIGNSSKIGGSAIGGGSVSIGNSTKATGGLFAANADLTLGNYAKSLGDCSVVGMLHLGSGASCADFPPGNDGSDATELVFQAWAEMSTFETEVDINCATQSLGPLTVGAGKKSTIVDNVSGFNLIQVDGIALKNSSSLTLSGSSNDTLVLQIKGDLSMGSGAHIKLAGGLVPGHVIVYVEGNSVWGNSTGVSADIFTLNGIVAGSGTVIDGVVLAEGGVTLGANTIITGFGLFDLPDPSQECQAQNGY
jgi:hypothetical protein